MKSYRVILLAAVLTVATIGIASQAQVPGENPALTATARLAFAHLAPFAPDPGTGLRIEVDGSTFAEELEFAGSTEYGDLPAGEHEFELFAAGSTDPVLSESFELVADQAYTLIASGGAHDWDLVLVLLTDDLAPPLPGAAKVRVGHLAPFGASAEETLVDIRFQDGTVVLNDVAYGSLSAYLPLPAGAYDFKITSADGTSVLIDPRPLTVEAGQILSAFAVGDGSNQPLGVFILPSGETGYMVPEAIRLFLPTMRRAAP